MFKTAAEIDQRWIIDLAADRAKYICQAQSLNLFLAGDVHKRDLHQLHFQAWKKGVKSLYYCRSTSIQRADKVSHKEEVVDMEKHADSVVTSTNYDECLACQ